MNNPNPVPKLVEDDLELLLPDEAWLLYPEAMEIMVQAHGPDLKDDNPPVAWAVDSNELLWALWDMTPDKPPYGHAWIEGYGWTPDAYYPE